MTNDQNGAPLSGDPYSNMKILFDATRLTGGNSGDVTINNNATQSRVRQHRAWRADPELHRGRLDGLSECQRHRTDHRH